MIKQNKLPKYAWWRDRKIVGSTILIITILIQVFAFLKVPFLSTINGYTVGMLMGFYNPLFYIAIAYISLKMIFKQKLRLPKWIKFTEISYIFLVLSIIYIGSSSGYYQTKIGWTAIGSEPWGSFPSWWDSFTSTTAWAPLNTNGGILGAFLFALSSMIVSGIGSFILSIIFIVCVISLTLTGSFIGLYRNLNPKRRKNDQSNKNNLNKKYEDEKSANQASYNSPNLKNNDPLKAKKDVENPKVRNNDSQKNDEDNLFPFEDPFK